MLKISELLVEYQNNPIGLDVKKPRFSWKLESDNKNVMQTAYQIIVNMDGKNCWDSGKCVSDQSIHIEYDGMTLVSEAIYSVKLTVWDNQKELSKKTASFETGLYGKFRADWITHNLPETDEACPVFKKEFSCSKEIKTARLYATALGIYDFNLNGRRVSDEYFSPGWTSYNKRLQYQTYDVTEYLKGANELKTTVANGWYKGNLAFEKRINIYGDRAAVLMELHITYRDGTRAVVQTDESWEYATGEVRYSEIYHGETMDKTFTVAEWLPVKLYNYDKSMITAQECEPVRIIKRLSAIELIITPEGDKVVDFGQNLTGFVEFVCDCTRGNEITLKHAEVLDKYGNFYTDNLRAAKATDRFICGGGMDIYRPRFTFHGFRYVKIEGMEHEIDISKIRACVLHTDMKLTGDFESSDEMVNQLQHNIQWGQRGNFLDVPTDCPQRDERLGWTGDAQVFAATAAYNFDVALFFDKWLKDLATDQGENGAVPYVIPDALLRGDSAVKTSAAWGDAAVIIPWTIYEVYGDIRILEQQYQSMKAWVDYLATEAGESYLWNTGSHFGDWLALDMEQFFTGKKFSGNSATGATDKHYIASAFFAYSTELLVKTAKVLELTDDINEYEKLYKNILQAFRKEYVTPNGRLVCETQTGLLLALKFNLIKKNYRKNLAKRLVDNLKRHNYQLVAGFVGSSLLCPVLTDNGYHDIAGRLLLQTGYPSWLYPVTKGATTIWERWNGIKPNGDFETIAMNSFNHYAYGAIGEWMYKSVLGINHIEPGYKKIRITPGPIEGLEFTSGSLNTMYGRISVSWKKTDDGIEADVKIPVNCTAVIDLPGSDETILLGSGEYQFVQ